MAGTCGCKAQAARTNRSEGPSASLVAREMSASRGRALPREARQALEPKLGHRLDTIRIHDGADAERWTDAGNATALTAGDHVAFAPGAFAPETPAGFELLAHEVVHAIQQRGSVTRPDRWGDPGSSAEVQADVLGHRLASGLDASPTAASSGVIQRQVKRPPPPRPPKPPPPVEEEAAEAGEAAEGEGFLGVAGSTLAGLAAGITVFLWDEDEAAPEWPHGQPNPDPQPKTNPRPDSPENKRGCFHEWVEQKGDNPCHDACATSISGIPLEYQLTTPDGVSVSFDALDQSLTLHEVKTGYRFMLNESPSPQLAATQQATLANWLAQSALQEYVADRCGYPLVWSFNEADVAAFADGLIAAPTEAVDCPCETPKPTKRRNARRP